MKEPRHRSMIGIFISLCLIACFFIPTMPIVKGEIPGSGRVFAPTAYSEFDFSGATYGYGAARMLDGEALFLYNAGAYAATEYYAPRTFYPTTYEPYWPPYDNRSDFPANDATIVSLSAIAIVRCTVPRDFSLYVWYWNGSSSSSYDRIDSPMYTSGTSYQLFSWNITALAPAALDARILKGTLGQFLVYLVCSDYTRTLYVDYIGIDYTWSGSTNDTIPDGEEGANPLSIPSPMGLLGTIGFVGMIGIPATGIWMARRSDESKGILVLQVLIAFVVCFGLFLASIS